MLSAGSPVWRSVMATSEAQVSRAQRSMVPRSMPVSCGDPEPVDADVVDVGATAGAAWALVVLAVVRVTAATAAPPARSWRRVAPKGVRVRAVSVMCDSLGWPSLSRTGYVMCVRMCASSRARSRVRASGLCGGSRCGSLDAGCGDARFEPVLEDEEDDQDGHYHHGCPGQQQAVVGRHLLVLGEQRQRHRQRVVLLGLSDHERPQEVVPAPEEGEDPERGQTRPAQGEDDLAEDAKLAGPIDPARV